jgi:iron(III) transport system ATP-binding protein
MANVLAADLGIEDLVKRFQGDVLAVDHLSLTVKQGSLTTLLGPSGCGKTTTLNCIAGLEEPDGGRITAGDLVLTDVAKHRILPPEDRQLGMVFQSYALWPHMTVHDNLEYGLKLRKVAAPEAKMRIGEALQLVGLEDLGQRYPFQLSGGQQQRVALARAVVAQPRVLLLDEPLSNLDAKVREQARFWLRDFQKRLGITTVYVTHDQAEALAISDMVALMSAGRLVQYAPPHEVYERPATRFAAEFVGNTSLLPGRVLTTSAGRVRVELAGGTQLVADSDRGWSEGARVVVAIRAERIELAEPTDSGSNVLHGHVQSFVYLGASYQYLIDTPAGQLRLDSKRPLEGEQVALRLPEAALVVLEDAPE